MLTELDEPGGPNASGVPLFPGSSHHLVYLIIDLSIAIKYSILKLVKLVHTLLVV